MRLSTAGWTSPRRCAPPPPLAPLARPTGVPIPRPRPRPQHTPDSLTRRTPSSHPPPLRPRTCPHVRQITTEEDLAWLSAECAVWRKQFHLVRAQKRQQLQQAAAALQQQGHALQQQIAALQQALRELPAGTPLHAKAAAALQHKQQQQAAMQQRLQQHAAAAAAAGGAAPASPTGIVTSPPAQRAQGQSAARAAAPPPQSPASASASPASAPARHAQQQQQPFQQQRPAAPPQPSPAVAAQPRPLGCGLAPPPPAALSALSEAAGPPPPSLLSECAGVSASCPGASASVVTSDGALVGTVLALAGLPSGWAVSVRAWAGQSADPSPPDPLSALIGDGPSSAPPLDAECFLAVPPGYPADTPRAVLLRPPGPAERPLNAAPLETQNLAEERFLGRIASLDASAGVGALAKAWAKSARSAAESVAGFRRRLRAVGERQAQAVALLMGGAAAGGGLVPAPQRMAASPATAAA